jgi:hypothetical protein
MLYHIGPYQVRTVYHIGHRRTIARARDAANVGFDVMADDFETDDSLIARVRAIVEREIKNGH